MRKIFKERLACRIFNGLAFVMFAVLFYYGLGLTYENRPFLWDEFVYVKQNSVIVNVLLFCVAVLGVTGLGKLSCKLQSLKVRNILLTVLCVVTGLISLYWVYACKVEPGADQLLICQFADAFNQGDFRGFNKGIYVARYPQQLGMITLLRVIFSIFGETNYLAFQYLSALLVPLTVLSGCKIVRILSDDSVRAELYYMFFVLFCYPMYAYTALVYGDLISVAFTLLAVWMYLACLKKFSVWRLVMFGVSIGLAVQLKENILIVVVAIGIVTIIKLLVKPNRNILLMLVALLAGVLFFKGAVWGLYRNVRQEDAPAIPMIMFVVMGLNDDYGYAGWHNNYEYETFDALGDNVEAANKRALEDLRMYANLYKNDPEYMVNFFVRKMNSQWNAPMYQGIAMNAEVCGEQLSPIKELYSFGRLTKLVELWMKVYQLLLYGSILFLLIVCRKKFIQIEKYILLIAVFGGFIFSLMWEAKTRYVMPYLFMMLPYMAMGLEELSAYVDGKLQQKKAMPKQVTEQERIVLSQQVAAEPEAE